MIKYKNKVHETAKEIIWEVEEVVKLEDGGIYNATYLPESIISTVILEDNEVLLKYLYKETKPEEVTGISNVTIEYTTSYGNKKTIVYTGIYKDSFQLAQSISPYVGSEVDLHFAFGGLF